MKKQLLIAAVAATFASVSMADISLSGAGNMKLNSDGSSTIDMDVTLKATSGATTATAKFKDLQTATAGKGGLASDVMVATTIEGITVKAGTVKTQGGNGTSYKKAAKNLVVSTKVAGFGVTGTTTANSGPMMLHVSGSVAGMDVKVQNANDSDARLVTIGGSFGGINVDLESSDNVDSYTVGGSFGGADVHYTSFTSETGAGTQDDGADFDTDGGQTKVTALVASMNGITVKRIEATIGAVSESTNKISTSRNGVKYTVSKTGTADAVLQAKVAFKF
jgi:hypothetical protein